ncbi:MAG: YraN family protein [Butyrivibrio sp.]|nr:YraN family protein [Butyrivibrio sp.]
MNKREIGAYYESIVCDYLAENGIKILERNFRCKLGEIDIVAEDNGYISFIEVKYRAGSKYGTAEAAVDFRKQKTVCRVSDFYCKRYGLSENQPRRFDVAAVNVEDGAAKINYIKNAFYYIPYGSGRRF